jgi:hypothetical protein
MDDGSEDDDDDDDVDLISSSLDDRNGVMIGLVTDFFNVEE